MTDFVILSGNGNVTVSARKGTGHVMPEHQTDTQVTLLAGSGVNGSTMLANVQCANCEDWSGGSLSLTSSSSDFIAAYRKGSPLDSSDPAESISIHDEKYQFNLDLTKATISSDTNPFTGAGATDNAVPSGGDSDSDSSESGGMSTRSIQAAHGVVMAVAMILLYPIGALLMPTLGNWLIHAIWQMIAFAAMWAGFALGVVLAERTGIVSHTTYSPDDEPANDRSPSEVLRLPHHPRHSCRRPPWSSAHPWLSPPPLLRQDPETRRNLACSHLVRQDPTGARYCQRRPRYTACWRWTGSRHRILSRRRCGLRSVYRERHLGRGEEKAL